jgi:superfamily I DNA and/or RNA helicase
VVALIGELTAAGVRDVMVVSPYNMQVNRLREALPAAVAVGTVDKFQGQEADVVVYSMASSSGEDVPRGLEFLLSRNRLNVAISRARCLASTRLLEVNCKTIPQMRLANALCRFVELAT